MSSFLNPDALRLFFGPHFDVDVAMDAVMRYQGVNVLKGELRDSATTGVPHTGIRLVGHHDVDTGSSIFTLMLEPGHMSGVSFFAESKHRLFGGSTLVCVPLLYCSTEYTPTGDHIVYRHTYKRPLFTQEELERITKSGTAEEQVKAFVFTKSRIGYETIKGMSYVGRSRRSWQQRYMEHVEEALEKNSNRRFHEAMRGMQGQNVICVHDISAYGIPEASAKMIERQLIKTSTLYPMGLNMRI